MADIKGIIICILVGALAGVILGMFRLVGNYRETQAELNIYKKLCPIEQLK